MLYVWLFVNVYGGGEEGGREGRMFGAYVCSRTVGVLLLLTLRATVDMVRAEPSFTAAKIVQAENGRN